MEIEQIAKVCHQANKAYCEENGDYSQLDWEEAPEWARQSAVLGVKAHVASGCKMTPEQSHEAWYAHKAKEGWVYGAEKDPKAKTHPCMVPYAKLPGFQRKKDELFAGIIKSLV